MIKSEYTFPIQSFVQTMIPELVSKSPREMFEEDINVAIDSRHLVERLKDTIDFLEDSLDLVRTFIDELESK